MESKMFSVIVNEICFFIFISPFLRDSVKRNENTMKLLQKKKKLMFVIKKEFSKRFFDKKHIFKLSKIAMIVILLFIAIFL